MKNRKPKVELKRIFAGVIAFIIIVALVIGLASPFFVHAKPMQGVETTKVVQKRPKIVVNPDIKITGEIGINGLAKIRMIAPVKIAIENKGETINGKVSVKLNVGEEALQKEIFNAYSEMVEVPESGSIAVEIEVPITTISPFQVIYLYDENGKVLASEIVELKVKNDDDFFVGAISDNKEGLGYFRGLNLNNVALTYDDSNIASRSDSKIGENFLTLDKNSFPKSLDIFRSFNMLVVDDFDLTTLSDENLSALEKWVEFGGLLVVSAGKNADKTLKGLSKEMIDVTADGVKIVGEFEIEKNELVLKKGQRLEITNLKGNDVAEHKNDKGDVLAVYKRVGNGVVYVLPIDLSTEPFTSLGNIINFLPNMFRPIMESLSADLYKEEIDISHISRNIPAFTGSKFNFIFIAVGVYCVFIGTVLYFILKKIDKRENAFFIIPILAISLTIVISSVSLSTPYSKPIISTASYLNLDDKAAVGTLISSTSIRSPKKGNIVVTTSKNIRRIVDRDTYNTFANTRKAHGEIDFEFIKGEKDKSVFYSASNWENNNISYNEDLTYDSAFDVDLKIANTKLVGTIKNNTGVDFDDIIVGVGYGNTRYADVKNGDTIQISQEVSFGAANYDIYNEFNSAFGDRNGDFFTSSEEEIRLINVKRSLYETSLNTLERAKYRANARIPQTASTAKSPKASGERIVEKMPNDGIKVEIFGFTTQKLGNAEIQIENETSSELFIGAVALNSSIDIEKLDIFSIPLGGLPVSQISANKSFEMYSDNEVFLNEADTNIEFHFNLLGKKIIDKFMITWRDTTGNVEIYDTEKKTWIPLNLETEYSGGKQTDFIDEKGILKVRLDNIFEAKNVSFPKISVEGSKK